MRNYLKFKLFCILQNPLFFIISLAFNLFCPVYFFLIKNFFGGNGSTDIYPFFFIVSAVSSIIIPVLCLNLRFSSFEDFIPLSSLKKTFVKCIVISIQFTLMLLPQTALPLCLNLFGDVDASIFFTGILFLDLFAFTAAALCLFLEELTGNALAAFFISSVVLGAVNGINFLMIYANPLPAVSSLIKAVSLAWHFDSAGKGILDTRDFFYFVIISVFFVLAAVFFENKKKGMKLYDEQKTAAICIVIILVTGLLNSNHFYVRHDISRDHKTSVSAYSKNILRLAEDKIHITYYRSSLLNDLYPQSRDIHDYLYELSMQKYISYEVKSPEKNGNTELLNKYGIYGRQFQTRGNNTTEFTTVYSTVVIEYAGCWDVIPFILSSSSLEYDLDVRLLNLISSKKRIVNVLCGNGLSLKNDYSYVVPWLNSQGFICNEIQLNDELDSQFAYSDLLMVLGSSKISEEMCAQIDAFIENGGKLFALTNLYSADIENNWYITENAETAFTAMLEKRGFGIKRELCADISCARITLTSEQNEEGKDDAVSRAMNYPLWISVMPQKNAPAGITLFWPEPVEPLNGEVKPLLYSSDQSWLIEPDGNSRETLFLTNPFGINEIKFASKKQRQILSLYSEGKDRIVLIPDQYFVNSLMLGYTGGTTGDYRNLDFMVNVLLKLNGEPELAEIQQKASFSSGKTLYKVFDSESFISAKNRTLFCMFILNPLIICAFWIFMIIRRKNLWSLR